jgi:hypothetical protein
MCRETSRVSFLMCPFCVRALMPIEATHLMRRPLALARGGARRGAAAALLRPRLLEGGKEGVRAPLARRALNLPEKPQTCPQNLSPDVAGREARDGDESLYRRPSHLLARTEKVASKVSYR